MGLHENRWLDNAVLDDRQLPSKPADRLDEPSGELLRRAAFLLPQDRLLVEMVLKNRVSYRQLSRATGVPPGTLCRRLKRVARRLLNPLVIALLEKRTPLADEYRQLAIEHFLQGRSLPDLAQHHQLKPTEVRRVIHYVRGWHQGLTSRWRA